MRTIRCLSVRLIEPRGTTSWRVTVLEVEVVVPRNITRLFRTLDLFVVLVDNDFLNHLAAERIDRMRDVRIQLRATICILRSACITETLAALIAILCTQVVLHTAAWAMRGQFAARHRNKRAVRTINNFQIAYNETVVKRNRAKCFQT